MDDDNDRFGTASTSSSSSLSRTAVPPVDGRWHNAIIRVGAGDDVWPGDGEYSAHLG